MDLKTTALLKLIYLEMFGHDMSWASFHVLEVMSSSKYLQKRVGYLAAVQSFRPETEVLMLATNLLKKDIASSSAPTISLPLISLPHVINPSLAMALLSDILPRLSHSNPNIRKKTVVTLYRMALVYPDSLQPAWPKIKDILTNETEDPSVTAAAVNVVCELGCRRPTDFLPLAPRLFELLIDGGNNWMAIKIIKLFAILTPMEPRLIRKLVPPLTTLIRTTPAMSLLYECINGIIQGGVFDHLEGVREGEEIATLCLSKLHGMIVGEGDPNLKYVSLLAFNKIVTSHPHLVSEYQDVILACIDDPDISIRLQALYLSVGMVNSDNLNMLVEALLQQLRTAPPSDGTANHDRIGSEPVRESTEHVLPPEYKTTVIRNIMDMCTKDTYSNIQDFEWYINILVQLVDLVPTTPHMTSMASGATGSPTSNDGTLCRIGEELRNVAVRMDFVRHNVVHASASLLHKSCKNPVVLARGEGVLSYVAWIVGEYANDLPEVEETLSSLLLAKIQLLAPTTLCAYLQAVPKLFVSSTLRLSPSWDAECQTRVSLLLARMIHFFESLATHPSLEVQERSVGFLELTRVAAQAVAGHDNSNMDCPLFLTDAFAQLFTSSKFNPMAPSAQRRVPVPDKLSLDSLFNPNLLNLLHMSDHTSAQNSNTVEFQSFYCNRTSMAEVEYTTASSEMMAETKPSGSYQDAHDFPTNVEVPSQKRQASRAREDDDPFYIANNNQSSKSSALFLDVSSQTKGDDTDIESIPIMDLDLGDSASELNISKAHVSRKNKKQSWQRYITPDETLEGGELPNPSRLDSRLEKSRKPLLEVDSSGLDVFASKGARAETDHAYPGDQDAEDIEMQKALREVERLRLEMQRASERVQVSEGISQDGTMVKKKKKKKKASAPVDHEEGSSAPVSNTRVVKGEIKRKKKSRPVADHSEDG